VTRKRLLWAFGTLAALLVVAAVAIPLVLQSQWLSDQVRARLVSEVESATGGRAAIGGFHFDWKQLRVELRNFTLHGTEPAAKPPLFHASEIAVGLKIVSVFRRDIDIQSLEVQAPGIYLSIAPDGSTNIPSPKVMRGTTQPVEALVNLAIGRFLVTNGVLEVENRGKTPFSARGQNLNAHLSYEAAVPRYLGNISLKPLELDWPGYSPLPVAVDLALLLERNRIGVQSATLAAAGSQLTLSGAVENLAAPVARLRYAARVAVPDAARQLRLKGLLEGAVQASGEAIWNGGVYSATGTMRASGVEYRDSTVHLRGCGLDGTLALSPKGIELSGARVAGNYVGALGLVPASGGIAKVTLRGSDLALRGLALRALNGEFRGDASLRDFDRYSVAGQISGFDARRAVAVYSREPIPWDAAASGDVSLQGSFRRPNEFELRAQLAIAPAGEGAPVRGHLNADYSMRTGLLDLGRSVLILPASRVDFSGILGRDMRVRLETRDLNELLPALGTNAASIPVALASGGRLLFDGTVTGSLDRPQVSGKLAATAFRVSGKDVDSLQGSVIASPENARIDNATVVRKSVKLSFHAAVSLSGWQTSDASQIFGAASLRGAAAADVLAEADAAALPLTGTLSGTAQFSGTVGNPLGAGDFEVTAGSLYDEPFDRIGGHATYRADEVALTSGVLESQSLRMQTAAAFRHPAGHFDSGRLHFQVSTNTMSISQIATIAKSRPGLEGSLLIKAAGDFDLVPQKGGTAWRLASLDGEATGDRLEFSGQPLGHAQLQAHSQGNVLKASMSANLAESEVQGEGQWQIGGDYQGTATIQVASFRFEQLQPWLPPSLAGRFLGSADGELRIDGPALKPEQIKAELRLPKLSIVPPAQSGVPASMALTNSGPIVATLADSVVTIGSARLTGPAGNVSLTGKARLGPKSALDLHLTGRVELRMIHDFDRNLDASGAVSVDTAIRGEIEKPQIGGRMEFQNASFNVVDFPNGISNANGLILFSGDRATIQRFTGETGGGQIELSGFASYNGGPLVFHVRADAKSVRVRYPEGVSTVANASLRFTGSSDRSNLSGTITILRTGFNLKSDFSSLLAQSAEPVQTPSARTGLLGGLNFDIQINTSPDIQFESSLTQDLQVEANLRLRGTATNPALVGRVNVTHGQVIFYGSRFNVSQGSISFYNALKVEPVLDVDLETKARGVDITLTVSGPLNKLNLTPRSDPPLQFNEIVALLATGRAPTSDPTLLAQQTTAPNAWQQSGASALLGQAIASPVAGRLQRFFGVSKLRIDPTLPGVENNPQARLTLEQQVTPEITFTYITNVTSSNPLVIRVEWDLSKQWSVVALREENGVFGLDFYYRKRF
jgi:translocation and assembly module TamB